MSSYHRRQSSRPTVLTLRDLDLIEQAFNLAGEAIDQKEADQTITNARHSKKIGDWVVNTRPNFFSRHFNQHNIIFVLLLLTFLMIAVDRYQAWQMQRCSLLLHSSSKVHLVRFASSLKGH